MMRMRYQRWGMCVASTSAKLFKHVAQCQWNAAPHLRCSSARNMAFTELREYKILPGQIDSCNDAAEMLLILFMNLNPFLNVLAGVKFFDEEIVPYQM